MEKEKQFETLIREHKSTIYTVCYMFSSDQDEVADLFQEILINLWNGYDSFRNEARVDTWIYRVSMNTCISADRKKKRAGQQIPLSMDVNLYEDKSAEAKQIKLLHNRIHKLGVIDRAIVMLWLENLSYDEIGSIIGISPSNVSVKLVRIKEQLKNMNDEQ